VKRLHPGEPSISKCVYCGEMAPIEIDIESVPGRRPKVKMHLTYGSLLDDDVMLNKTAARKLAQALLDVADALELEMVHEA